jgi:hypothetical protein
VRPLLASGGSAGALSPFPIVVVVAVPLGWDSSEGPTSPFFLFLDAVFRLPTALSATSLLVLIGILRGSMRGGMSTEGKLKSYIGVAMIGGMSTEGKLKSCIGIAMIDLEGGGVGAAGSGTAAISGFWAAETTGLCVAEICTCALSAADSVGNIDSLATGSDGGLAAAGTALTTTPWLVRGGDATVDALIIEPRSISPVVAPVVAVMTSVVVVMAKC